MKSNSPEALLEEFMALSRVLTGIENLEAERGRAYLERLLSSPLMPPIQEVLTRFRQNPRPSLSRIEQAMSRDANLRATMCQIILLWYTSALRDNASDPIALRYGSEQEYFGALVWRLIGAHPPGLSGGYFGHWRYRPDNQ